MYLFLQQKSLKGFVTNDIIDNIEKILKNKKNRNCIFKKVTLKDIIEKNIYRFQYKNETFFAPMWHCEVDFETSNNEEFSVQFIPILPDNVWINENNELCIFLKLQFDNTLLLSEYVTINIDNYEFNILSSEMKCIKNQLITLKNKGLWKIQQMDMFNVNEKGDVKIYLEFD